MGKLLNISKDNHLHQILDTNISESKCFRRGRSTLHSIQILRSVQKRCKAASFYAYVDFQKAFDSPPRTVLLECLEWIEMPAEMLALIAACHSNSNG